MFKFLLQLLERQKYQELSLRDVGILSTGQAPITVSNLHLNHSRIEARDLIEDQDLFKKKTGISETSMPERVALLRLLEENVKCSQLKRIWRDELTFDDRKTPMLKITILPGALWATGIAAAITIIAQVFMSLPTLFNLTPQERGFAAGIWLVMVCVTGWILWQHFFPYVYAKRMRRFVDEINPELLELLARWRAPRWYQKPDS